MTDQQTPDPDQLLRAALAKPGWEPDSRARVRLAVENEWRVASGATRLDLMRIRRRWYVALAAAASIALAGVALRALNPQSDGALFGTVSRLSDGTLQQHVAPLWDRGLGEGGVVRVGYRLQARGSALITLAPRGNLRVAAGSALDITDATAVTLRHGTIYLDDPPERLPGDTLRIVTAAGVVEHAGTAFEVLSTNDYVRIRVREGRVRLSAGPASVQADAGTELRAVPGAPVTRRPVATAGQAWQWTAALAPEIAIEGRPLIEYLQAVSREVGQPLSFADPQARESAQRIVLHGSVKGVPPLDALTQVMASTSLGHEISNGTIRVHSQP
jgi:ferric-dicitrate binding protein FerR (iron transport regulator)